MTKRSSIVCALIALMFSMACTSTSDSFYVDRFWIMTSKADVYSLPNPMSRLLETLKFGDEVLGRDKKPMSNTPKDWLQIRVGQKDYGYVERSKLADQALMNEVNALIASVKDKQPQATGTVSKRSRFRLSPGRDAKLLEFLKDSQNAEIYERVVLLIKEKNKDRKEIWYKVRLEDGRVGYAYTANLNFIPPTDLNQYTQSRKIVAWQLLRTREDAEAGVTGRDYIAAYIQAGIDTGSDFTRVELYTFDLKSKQYSTAFAKSGLKGILPLNIIDDGNDKKIIQLKQLVKGRNDKLLVQEYSFPNPIKLVRQYEEDTTPMPH